MLGKFTQNEAKNIKIIDKFKQNVYFVRLSVLGGTILDEQKQFTLFAGEPTAEGIYKNKKTKAQFPFVKAAEMKEAFPAGGYRVVGQIGKGKEQIGVLHDEDADEPVYKSQKMSLTKIVGFVQVGENEFVAVLKSTVWLLLLILLLLALLCGLTVFLVQTFRPEPAPEVETTTAPPLIIDVGAEEGEGKLEIPDKIDTTNRKIKVNGVPEIHLKANQLEQNFPFSNPAGNPCFFVIDVIMKDSGEVIYTSDMIPPGYAVSNFKLKKPLAAGKYNVVVRYNTFTFDQQRRPLNNMVVNTVIVAEEPKA